MDKVSKLLIDALACSVAGKAAVLPEAVDWRALMRLANEHDVHAMLYDGLHKCGGWESAPEPMQQRLRMIYMQSIYMNTQRDYIRDRLQQQLIQAQVPHVFLKGICLKESYPEPALRSMCDVDALVYTRDYGKIEQVARNLGGISLDGDGNHNTFQFRNGVTVEFHPNLLHHSAFVGTRMNPGWQYVKEENPTASMELTEEGFYLNVLCHLAHHFVCGGVGVRFILDVWVCRNLRREQPDRAFVEHELEHMGLLEFCRNIEALAECWFGNGTMTPELEELGDYILTSGSHGTIERAMLNAVSLAPKGNSAAALWKKIFYPKEELEDRFPWCKGKAVLLPAAWFARAWGAVTKRGNLILDWSKGVNSLEREEVRAQQERLRRFGIQLP